MDLLFDSTLKGSLMVAAALAVMRLLKGRSAAVRHGLLAAALCGAAMMPALQAIVPTLNVGLVPAVVAGPVKAVLGDRPAAQPDVRGARVVGAGDGPGPAPAEPTHYTPLLLVDVLRGLWAAGAGLSLAVLVIGLARLRWLTARSQRLTSGRWVDLTTQIAFEYGIRRRITLAQTAHRSLLVTWGCVRPMIMLPVGAATWSDDRIRIVLAHELEHIRRHDWILQLAAECLRSIYWFNPLFWMACRRLRDESECACDDAVLRRGADGSEYAWQLLHLARAFKYSPAPRLPASAMARRSSLERRIGAMLDVRIDRRPMSWRAALFTLSMPLLVALPLAAAQAGAGSFEGTVLNPGGDIAADARVVLSQGVGGSVFEALTDMDGRFEIGDVPAGTYRLDIWGSDDARAPMGGLELTRLGETVAIWAGQRLRRDLTLSLAPISVSSFVVVDSVTGERIGPRETGFPASWQCLAGLGMNSYCGPPSLLEEFERDFRERGRVPQNVQMPRLIARAVPNYPEALRGSGLTGVVTIEGRIGTNGVLEDLRLVGASHRALVDASLAAAREMRWEPARVKDVPTAVPIQLDVEFQIRSREERP